MDHVGRNLGRRDMWVREGGRGEGTCIKAFKGLKKFSVVGGNNVCPCILLQFMSVRLCQFTS